MRRTGGSSEAMKAVTRDDIVAGLAEVGLRVGDTVVVHSSLSSFGEVEGGAEAVADALLEALGTTGTLVVPTFNADPGAFDAETTPSQTGAVTEALRQRKNAIRSQHPTHSVVAIGRLAEVITEDHHKVDAFARGSALFKVLQANGKILQLGTDHTTNSMIHVAEEIAAVPYIDRQRLVAFKRPDGGVARRWIRRPGCSQGFGALEDPVRERDLITEALIGKCRARLMPARGVVEVAVELLKADPEALLCSRPDCGGCAEARAAMAAIQAEEADRQIIEIAEEDERTLRMMQERLDSIEISYFEPDKQDQSPN